MSASSVTKELFTTSDKKQYTVSQVLNSDLNEEVWGIDYDRVVGWLQYLGYSYVSERKTIQMINKYYIWSIEHEAWWNPGQLGYTTHISTAGKYSEEESEKICKDANKIKTEEIRIPVQCIFKETKIKPQLPGPDYIKEGI